MPQHSTKKSLLITLSVFALIIFGTYFITLFARGYRLDFRQNPGIKATGLLSATSKPKSASVYIDDRLFTATDDTINLPPDQYHLKIVKDGYLPWEKTIQIKKETVYQTDTQLFRSVPDLKPLTFTGAINPAASPDFSRVVYAVASASAAKDNGLYLIELSSNFIPVNRSSIRQLAPNFPNVDWSNFKFTFSPDSREILATSSQNISYLLRLDTPISTANLFDVTARLPLIKEEWQNQDQLNLQDKIDKLPKEIRPLISTQSAQHLQLSPDENKFLYLATIDGQISPNLITPPPAQSTQDQQRQVKAGNYYVYDLLDDTNFFIGSAKDLLNPTWLPLSNNIIYVQNSQMKVVEYDNTNLHTLFAGDFDQNTVFPWSDGNRIVTLTTPYQGAGYNLFSLTIR